MSRNDKTVQEWSEDGTLQLEEDGADLELGEGDQQVSYMVLERIEEVQVDDPTVSPQGGETEEDFRETGLTPVSSPNSEEAYVDAPEVSPQGGQGQDGDITPDHSENGSQPEELVEARTSCPWTVYCHSRFCIYDNSWIKSNLRPWRNVDYAQTEAVSSQESLGGDDPVRVWADFVAQIQVPDSARLRKSQNQNETTPWKIIAQMRGGKRRLVLVRLSDLRAKYQPDCSDFQTPFLPKPQDFDPKRKCKKGLFMNNSLPDLTDPSPYSQPPTSPPPTPSPSPTPSPTPSPDCHSPPHSPPTPKLTPEQSSSSDRSPEPRPFRRCERPPTPHPRRRSPSESDD